MKQIGGIFLFFFFVSFGVSTLPCLAKPLVSLSDQEKMTIELFSFESKMFFEMAQKLQTQKKISKQDYSYLQDVAESLKKNSTFVTQVIKKIDDQLAKGNGFESAEDAFKKALSSTFVDPKGAEMMTASLDKQGGAAKVLSNVDFKTYLRDLDVSLEMLKPKVGFLRMVTPAYAVSRAGCWALVPVALAAAVGERWPGFFAAMALYSINCV